MRGTNLSLSLSSATRARATAWSTVGAAAVRGALAAVGGTGVGDGGCSWLRASSRTRFLTSGLGIDIISVVVVVSPREDRSVGRDRSRGVMSCRVVLW